MSVEQLATHGQTVPNNETERPDCHHIGGSSGAEVTHIVAVPPRLRLIAAATAVNARTDGGDDGNCDGGGDGDSNSPMMLDFSAAVIVNRAELGRVAAAVAAIARELGEIGSDGYVNCRQAFTPARKIADLRESAGDAAQSLARMIDAGGKEGATGC